MFSSLQDRRTFVRNGVLTATALSFGSAARRLQGASDAESYRMAILSDTHIPADVNNEYRGFKPWENLKRIVPDILASKPEGAIINGDAARLTGEVEDYVQLKKLLNPVASQCPIYIGMGNHDDRTHFDQVIQTEASAKANVSNKHVMVIEHPVVRIIQLDSLLYVNKVAGLLGKNQRDWLTRFLSESDDKPTVFFVHHTLGEDDGDLLDTEKMFAILRPHQNVKAVFYGHSHTHVYGFRDGKHLINLPAVGYNFNDAQPVGWMNGRFHPHGVDLTLNAIGGNLNDHGKTVSLKW
jgi:3',5'-cyclic AMP phosphodiesterase CpdA